jgi:hypothetical protein
LKDTPPKKHTHTHSNLKIPKCKYTKAKEEKPCYLNLLSFFSGLVVFVRVVLALYFEEKKNEVVK